MLEKIKSALCTIYKYTCKIHVLLFAVIVACTTILLGKTLPVVVTLTYVYTITFYLLSKVIRNKGFKIIEIIVLFVPLLIAVMVLVEFLPNIKLGA